MRNLVLQLRGTERGTNGKQAYIQFSSPRCTPAVWNVGLFE
jgi:hypothetical protein